MWSGGSASGAATWRHTAVFSHFTPVPPLNISLAWAWNNGRLLQFEGLSTSKEGGGVSDLLLTSIWRWCPILRGPTLQVYMKPQPAGSRPQWIRLRRSLLL